MAFYEWNDCDLNFQTWFVTILSAPTSVLVLENEVNMNLYYMILKWTDGEQSMSLISICSLLASGIESGTRFSNKISFIWQTIEMDSGASQVLLVVSVFIKQHIGNESVWQIDIAKHFVFKLNPTNKHKIAWE